jgi:hypothetical protein
MRRRPRCVGGRSGKVKEIGKTYPNPIDNVERKLKPILPSRHCRQLALLSSLELLDALRPKLAQ